MTENIYFRKRHTWSEVITLIFMGEYISKAKLIDEKKLEKYTP